MPIRFKFRDVPLRIKNSKDADPQKIGEALWKLTAANKGRLQKQIVVDAARNRNHLLHRHFEWNDKIAAEAHRREQAGELIKIIIRDDSVDESVQPRRAFLSVHDKEGTSYRTVDEVLTSVDLQLAVLVAANRELKAFEERYRELIDICDLVRSAREKLSEKIKQTTEERAPQ